MNPRKKVSSQMVVEHHREKHFNADKLERLNFTIREFDIRNYKQLGRLFGMEENQFRTIGELETLLKSLRTKSTSKTASALTEETEKAFLNTQINMLNQYKNYLLTEINQREKERNLKKNVEASVGMPVALSRLISAHSNLISGFDSIQHSIAITVNHINEKFEKDIKSKEAQIELATALLKVALSVVGAGAVGEIIGQAIKNANPESIEELTGAAGKISLDAIKRELAQDLTAATIDTITDDMLIHINKVVQSTSSRISLKFQDQVTLYLTILKSKSCGEITKAIERVGQITLTPEEWDKELDATNKAKLLSMNPNHLDALVSEVRNEMQLKTLYARENAAALEYQKLSQPIKKIIEFAALEVGPHFVKRYQEKMAPISEYFQIHFVSSVLSREYRKPDALKHGYKSAVDRNKYEGYESMVRNGHVKHFPKGILQEDPHLLMMFEPTVMTGNLSFNQEMHKGGKNLRRFLATQISGIKENVELYGLKKSNKDSKCGVITRKGAIEDMLRSYAIIVSVMEGAVHHHKHQSSIPLFKEDREVLAILKTLMEINLFFTSHPDNKNEPLITPLCVFNRDPHFMDLIKQRPVLRQELVELILNDSFILKCLTDPNLKEREKDSKRLYSMLDELIILLETAMPEIEHMKISEFKEQAKQYIEHQCAQIITSDGETNSCSNTQSSFTNSPIRAINSDSSSQVSKNSNSSSLQNDFNTARFRRILTEGRNEPNIVPLNLEN
ncbi:hypothetical protein [Legionella sainthelensi]|uniref:Uncharacterized protein n=1 Tax=Legionella sainthelensi TaxID=28087 RepID=A0A2H5FQA3_9GAMM|nr:hypothetical protein [Legionella sainthelensi]AUH73673.1 hypothetical protein CAB17_17705 [Legionella sainthelensi]